MELTQLEAFLAVAREGSFSRAAQRLHRTQPAVSQGIRKLEAELGEVLFDRSSHNGILTDAGRVLAEHAEKLLNLRAETRRALTELRQMHTGNLVAAANEYTSLYLLPVLDAFRRAHPLAKVTVQRSYASRIPQQILNHQVELGVLSFRPEERELRSIVVYRDELVFVVPPGHAFAGGSPLQIRQLGTQAFVAHNVPSPYRAKVLEAFRRHKTSLNMPVELPTIEAIKKFVAMGNGVALVPGICVQSELESGQLIAVKVREIQFERKLRLVYRRKSQLSHIARALLQCVRQMSAAGDRRYLFQPEP